MSLLLIAIGGPTASGKSLLAERLSESLGCPIVNADRFQMVRGMDIGTAKPERREGYRLLDHLTPDEPYTVGGFVKDGWREIESAWKESRICLIAGGTGLYLRAVTDLYDDFAAPPSEAVRDAITARERAGGFESLREWLLQLSPESFRAIDHRNPVRVRRAIARQLGPPPVPSPSRSEHRLLKVVLEPAMDLLKPRIEHRVKTMLGNGWQEEVLALIEAGFGPLSPGFQAIGYRAIAAELERNSGVSEELRGLVSQISAETWQYARRQFTWFRREKEALRFADQAEAFSEVSRQVAMNFNG